MPPYDRWTCNLRMCAPPVSTCPIRSRCHKLELFAMLWHHPAPNYQNKNERVRQEKQTQSIKTNCGNEICFQFVLYFFTSFISCSTYSVSSTLKSSCRHFRWVPGTLNDVINMVTQRSRNTVPDRAKKRRNNTKRCLCTIRTLAQMRNSSVPVISHMWNAHGMWGTLSRNMSGSGGYLFISGTRSWTTTITNAVIHVTKNA